MAMVMIFNDTKLKQPECDMNHSVDFSIRTMHCNSVFDLLSCMDVVLRQRFGHGSSSKKQLATDTVY